MKQQINMYIITECMLIFFYIMVQDSTIKMALIKYCAAMHNIVV